MPKPPRLAWDSSCFTAWAHRKDTEDQDCLQALDAKFAEMTNGNQRIVASRIIEIEVRLDSVEQSRQFHRKLRACSHFESFGESPAIRRLAFELADRIQASERRGKYADLIHVATAISSRAVELWTLDKKMVRWTTEGVITEIVICRPHLDQGVLPLE